MEMQQKVRRIYTSANFSLYYIYRLNYTISLEGCQYGGKIWNYKDGPLYEGGYRIYKRLNVKCEIFYIEPFILEDVFLIFIQNLIRRF